MFLSILPALSLLLLQGVAATPLHTRQTITPPALTCSDSTTSTTLTYPFTLAAVYLSEPNSNATGVPIVLASGGAIDGASFEYAATYASYPYNEFPYLTLTSSGLKAYYPSGETYTNATGCTSSSSISFLTTGYAPYTDPPAPIFLAVSCPENPFPILSANGYTDQWSLCPLEEGQVQLTYNASAEVGNPYPSYNASDCLGVAVNIVPYTA